MIGMYFYRMNENVELPTFATRQSACFDLRCFFHKETVVAYSPDNTKKEIEVSDGKIVLPSGYRARFQPDWSWTFPKDTQCDFILDLELL